MTETHDESKRARLAVAIASAMTTLAAGVTIAALSGYLHAPSAAPPVTEPAPGGTEAAPRAPVQESEPAVVLVPVERIPASPPAVREAEALAYADYDVDGHDRDDDHDESDEREGHHDD